MISHLIPKDVKIRTVASRNRHFGSCALKGTHGKMVNEKTRWPPYFFNLKNDFMEPGTSFRSKNWSSDIAPIKKEYKGAKTGPLYFSFIGAISELQFFDLKLVPGSIKSFSELKKYGGHLGFRIASLKLCFTMCALKQKNWIISSVSWCFWRFAPKIGTEVALSGTGWGQLWYLLILESKFKRLWNI